MRGWGRDEMGPPTDQYLGQDAGSVWLYSLVELSSTLGVYLGDAPLHTHKVTQNTGGPSAFAHTVTQNTGAPNETVTKRGPCT